MAGGVGAVAPLSLINCDTSLLQSMAAATAERNRMSLNGGVTQLKAKVNRDEDGLVEISTKPRASSSVANLAGTDSITSKSPSLIKRTRVLASGAHVTMISSGCDLASS